VKATQLFGDSVDNRSMAVISLPPIRFPVNSPHAVPIAPSRLIKDAPQVFDDIHDGKAVKLRLLFDDYKLPPEGHVLAMEQFAALIGISREVDPQAVEKMRTLLGQAGVDRDMDADGIMLLSQDDVVLEDDLNLRHYSLKELAESLLTLLAYLKNLETTTAPKGRALGGLQALAQLTLSLNREKESLLNLGTMTDEQDDFDAQFYDRYRKDIQSFIKNRDQFLELFLQYIKEGLPEVTEPYLIARDQFELGAMAARLASNSPALLRMSRERASKYPDRHKLEPLAFFQSWRAMMLWQHEKMKLEELAQQALRILHFQAKQRAIQRTEKLEVPQRHSALQDLREDK
jgi:hypothetical protein